MEKYCILREFETTHANMLWLPPELWTKRSKVQIMFDEREDRIRLTYTFIQPQYRGAQ